MINIKKEAETALYLLTKNGYEAYLVGGCVRDSILGRDFDDYDITTNALPDEIKRVFKEYKTIDTGIKHGTVTVIIDSLSIEITTYRIDGEYTDNRHPDNVVFSQNLKDDLSRRDFTMNAVCYNGKYVDLFCGIEDLGNKTIRCVGEPLKRFTEDALRILRALRFSSCLGFDIEEETGKAIIECIHLLSNVSGERIAVELKKLICGNNAGEVISKYAPVFDFIFQTDNTANKALLINSCPCDFSVRLALMLLDSTQYKEVIKRLKLDNKTAKRVASSIENYNTQLIADSVFIKCFINKHGTQTLRDVIDLKQAHKTEISDIENILNCIIENKECYCIQMLDVNGNDLVSMGINGKEIGFALDFILKNVIEGKIDNNKEKILEFIKERNK